MGALAVVSVSVVVVAAAVTVVCVAVVEHESRRLDAAARRLAALVAGSPGVGGTR